MAAITQEQAKEEALARFADPGPGHINCAQAVLCYALLVDGHDPGLITVARYLGGGVALSGETCGAITGAALALGFRDLYLTDEAPTLRPRTVDHLQQLIQEFAAKFGTCRCRDLTGYDMSTFEGLMAFRESEARIRCRDYVGWMIDRLTPLLLEPDGEA
jgi:C_GCAxxG_C_C family probable redox protein